MITAHEWLAGEVGWWWPSVADHLWQATIFALIALLASLALKRGPARLRHSLWLLASAKFIVPAGLFVFLAEQAGINPSWFFRPNPGSQLNASLLQGITSPIAAIANSYEITVVATDAIRHNEIYCALVLIWLAGSVAFLGVWVMRRRQFFRALEQGRSMEGGREWHALERAKESLRWKTGVELVISPHETEPAVCRVWKPVVLLPQAIADHLDDVELEAIMLHELVHIKRRDNLIGNLQMMVCALLWFHPLVWFISSKLFDERELACDEEVLKIHGAPEAYASSILKVVRFSLGWRVAGVTGAGSGSNLRRRIENIMSTNDTKRGATAWHRLLAGTLVGFALVLMVFAGVYTRARNANAAVKDPAVQETSVGSVAESGDSLDFTAPTDGKGTQTKRIKPPPPPPEPATPATPSTPSAPATPATPAAPQTAADPATAPTSPTAPTAPTASTPPSPPAPPAPPAKEKTESKNKEKQKDDKDKVEKGVLIEAPPPVYPDEAKKQKIEGTVVVTIVIGDEGNVISAKAKSGPEALYAASEQAASKARFKPTMLNGKPAKVTGAMTYNFVLDKK